MNGLEGYDVMKLEHEVAVVKREIAALRRMVEVMGPHKVIAMRQPDPD